MNTNDISADSIEFNDPLTVTSGIILTTIVHGGLPEDLVVPIEAPTIGNADTGKRPAMLNAIGEWNGLHDWPTREFPTALLLQASQDHGNCGLRLGRISEREPAKTKIPLALVYEPRGTSSRITKDSVADLMQSMKASGLLTPITVRSVKRMRDLADRDVWEVVSGRRRVEAARCLGWTEIEAVIDGAPEPRLNVFAIDIDLGEGQEASKDAILAALARHCGGRPMPWRSTWSYRALVLVNVLNMDSGRQHNWEAKRHGDTAGKIQLLTYGAQCVVAGTHYSGNPIAWHVAGDDRVWPWPPIKQVGLPAFESFDALVAMLNAVWQELKAEGFEFPLQSVSKEGMAGDVDAGNLAPPELTPADVVNLFERMSSPASVDRHVYKDIGLAAGGTLRGIEHHHGQLSQGEEDDVTRAWVEWATRWEGTPVGTPETEKEKWLKDFRLNGRVAGWRQLVGHADRLGAGIASDTAQREFTAEHRYLVNRNDGSVMTSWGDVQHDWYVRDTSNGMMMAGFDTEEKPGKLFLSTSVKSANSR
jgi:hypothetical protein